METAKRNPIAIYCKNCGAPAGFDIVRQTYRCPYCGQTSGIEEVKNEALKWRKLNPAHKKAVETGDRLEKYSCSGCGAEVMFEPGEASATCDFCGSRLIRKEFTSKQQFPDLIIPFYLTYEEVKERLLKWGKKHWYRKEGRAVVSDIGKLKGYYLPYQLIRGPIYGTIDRDASTRKYHCAGYLEGTLVSSEGHLNNLILNRMEPYDWSAMHPFEYGYIAGQKVELSDLAQDKIEYRVKKEVEEDFLPEVRKVMQTSGLNIYLNSGELYRIPVLLPVYFISSAQLTAVVNGQTGKIAATLNRNRISYPWVIEPLLFTIVCTLALSYFYAFNPEAMLLFGAVFACLFFAIFSEGRDPLEKTIILNSRTSRATRKEGELKIEEKDDILKNPYDNTPVFFEENSEGEKVPVRIRFYTLGRIISILWNCFVIVFLPAIIAGVIHLLQIMDTGEKFWDDFPIGYGAAWYVLAGFMVLLYLAKGVRIDVYDHPYLYEIRKDGKKRLLGNRRDRNVSFLSMFGIGMPDKDGKRMTLLRTLWDLGKMGFWLAFGLLFILLGCVAAILS